MTDESKATLLTIERCVAREAVSLHAAIEAAYMLGKMDGQLEMAKVSQKRVEQALSEVSPRDQGVKHGC